MFPSSGDGEIRTLDPLLARQVLSQLSYAPIPDGSLVWLFRKSLFQVLFQVFSPPVGLSGLEPPTSRLSGVRSNRLSYKPTLYMKTASAGFFFFGAGGHLLSHTVSSAVPSAVWGLTIVFGMGTGVSPERIATKKVEFLMNPHN